MSHVLQPLFDILVNGIFLINVVRGLVFEATRPLGAIKYEELSDRNVIFVGQTNDPFGASSIVVDPNLVINATFSPSGNAAEKKHQYLMVRRGRSSRSKRGVFQLYNMVSCVQGCDPLMYKGYGCYCGFLGSGFAVNGIDRCCQKHDWCYDNTMCPALSGYFAPYFWICFNNQPVCGITSERPTNFGSCVQKLCECDRQLSICLSKYPCPISRAICTSSTLRFLQNTLMIF